MAIEYVELPEFSQEFKKLARKYRSLPDDFTRLKKNCLELYHIHRLDNSCVVEINALDAIIPVFKVRKMACQVLKGKGNRSGFRIIYSWHQVSQTVRFLEIYHKTEKDKEDRQRIRDHLRTMKKAP